MSFGKRKASGSESPDLRGSKRQLFGELETDAPCVCAIDFGTARTGYAYAFTRNAHEIKVKEPGGQEPGKVCARARACSCTRAGVCACVCAPVCVRRACVRMILCPFSGCADAH